MAQDRRVDRLPRRKATTEVTSALAHSRRPRWGTAAREERICPEEYSPVITSAARTATTTCPKVTPRVML